MVIIISSSRKNKTNPNPEVTENVCLGIFEPLSDVGEKGVSYGGINEISVLDPLPAVVGFTNVVSMRVQPSPLRPQEPSIRCGRKR